MNTGRLPISVMLSEDRASYRKAVANAMIDDEAKHLASLAS